jgi:hypothetical protein
VICAMARSQIFMRHMGTQIGRTPPFFFGIGCPLEAVRYSRVPE